MATAALNLGPFKLATTETVLVTVAAGHDYNLNAVRFTNTDTFARLLTIYEYKPPGTAADVESLLISLSLNVGEMFEYGPVILAGTRVLSAKCDTADKITVHVSGWDHS
jgi:hypothetical protein